jgi:hypothetical protein
MFELDVVLQSRMPYVQMGLSITLQMRSLLVTMKCWDFSLVHFTSLTYCSWILSYLLKHVIRSIGW